MNINPWISRSVMFDTTERDKVRAFRMILNEPDGNEWARLILMVKCFSFLETNGSLFQCQRQIENK